MLLLISFNIISAQETEEEKATAVYKWLEDQVDDQWETLNTKENVLALLALQCNSSHRLEGNYSLWRRSFGDDDYRCWGEDQASSESECELVETAMAKVALEELGYNTTKTRDWLLSKNKTQTDIHWYLQIDIDRGSEALCEIYYLGRNESGFKINTDKSVELQNPSHCFQAVSPYPGEKYWFSLKQTAECLDAEYIIKCRSENSTYFSVSMLYKENPSSKRWYVSSVTKSGIPGKSSSGQEPDALSVSIPSYCLSESGLCNYEGTLWATYALVKQGDNDKANLFIPYLILNEDKYPEYFPSAFLSALVNGRFTEKAVDLQQFEGFWIIQKLGGGTLYGTLYNTALAKLLLGDTTADFEKAKALLLTKYKSETQEKGYFTHPAGGSGESLIRDNAFLLWTFWPQFCPGYRGGSGDEWECELLLGTCKENCTGAEQEKNWSCPSGLVCCKLYGGGGNGGGSENCGYYDGSCRTDCESDESPWPDGICGGDETCCVPYLDLLCEEDLNGESCTSTQECSDIEVETLDELFCCLGECIEGGTSNMTCSDIGSECETGFVCLDEYTRRVMEFTNTIDSDRCCVDGICVRNVYCSDIGSPCETGECIGNIVETIDEEYCCEGSCLQDCEEELGGQLCSSGQSCSGSLRVSAENPNSARCCVNGICEDKGGFPWWIIIIIVVLIIIVALYFFVFKKKNNEEETDMFGNKVKRKKSKHKDIEAMPVIPRQRPGIMRRPFIKKQIQKSSPTPMKRPMPQLKPLPRLPPTLPKPTTIKPTKTIKKKTVTKKTRTKKTKRSELESTLKKLKKLSKSKK